MKKAHFPYISGQKFDQSKCSLGEVYLFLLSLDINDVEDLHAMSDKVVIDNQSGGKHD